MNTGSKTLKVKSFYKHLVKRDQQKKSRRRIIIAALMLTSMVDMFSLLVIFLLQTFSTSPDLMMVTKGIVLPAASSGREFMDAPVLSLTNEHIFLDQKPIGDTEVLLKDPTPLMKHLSDLRELWEKTHPNEKFTGEISLQAHREMPSSTVSQIISLLPAQHYSQVQLAVVSRGGGQ